MSKIISLCNITFEKTILKTGPYKRRCRYHRVQGQEFNGNNIFPKGFCPHAYRIAYPYCLSLLYNAKFPLEGMQKPFCSARTRCPSRDNYIEIGIYIRYTLSLIIRKLKNIIIGLLHFFKIQAEYLDKEIMLKVLGVKGKCPLGIKEGQSFMFNIHNRNELCPASFYALYPMLMQQEASPLKFKNDRKKISIHCPDPYGVYYTISYVSI